MNKLFLMGRLVRDPELKYTNSSTAVCNFTLAVDRRFAKEGQQQADFIPVVTWQKTAEFCAKYFVKGQKVAVIGRLQVRPWEDSEGNKRYATEVVAEEVDFADGKRSNAGDAYEPTSNSNSSSGFYPLDEDTELPF